MAFIHGGVLVFIYFKKGACMIHSPWKQGEVNLEAPLGATQVMAAAPGEQKPYGGLLYAKGAFPVFELGPSLAPPRVCFPLGYSRAQSRHLRSMTWSPAVTSTKSFTCKAARAPELPHVSATRRTDSS